jgi:hypothetical protein
MNVRTKPSYFILLIRNFICQVNCLATFMDTFTEFNYFYTPTYALVSYAIKTALIVYIKTLYSLTAPTCFDT